MIGRQGNGLRLKVSIFPQVVGSSFSSNTVTGHLICWPWLHVQVWVPLSAPIGQWQITVVTWVNNRRGKHLVEKMNIFQGRRFERAQGWQPDLCAFQPLASRRPNPHAKVFNCQDLYCKLLPVSERGLSTWWRRRERSTPGLIRNLAAGFFKYGLNDVFIKLQLSRPWVYGQFSPTVLPAVCHLLHTSPYLRPAERANPVKVCSTFPTNWKHKPWFWKTNMN